MTDTTTKPQEQETVPANTSATATPPADTTASETAKDEEATDALRSEGALAERHRVAEITKITRAAMLPDNFAQKLVNDGTAVTQAPATHKEALCYD